MQWTDSSLGTDCQEIGIFVSQQETRVTGKSKGERRKKDLRRHTMNYAMS